MRWQFFTAHLGKLYVGYRESTCEIFENTFLYKDIKLTLQIFFTNRNWSILIKYKTSLAESENKNCVVKGLGRQL